MPKHIWLLVIGIAINVTGSSFIWPLNTIYIHNELGQTLAFAGVVLMLNQGAGIFGNLLGGVLYDRLGGYITITYGNIISIAASVALIFYHSILSYTILMIVLGLGSGVARPAMFAMASSVWPEGGRRAFNALYVAQNLGVAIGASLGGFVAKFSFEYIFIANALFFFVFFLLAVLTYKPIDSKYDPHAYGTVLDQNLKIVKKANFRALIMLSIGFFICWVAYVQWQTTIASYTQDIGISIDRYSLLWTINGLLIVLGQPVIKVVTNWIPSTKVQIQIGHFIFLLSFIYLLFANSFLSFAIAMAILTIGEMLVWPGVPSLADDLAPKGRAGFYQGLINSVGTAGRMVGPVLGGFIVDIYSIEILFYGLLILFIIPFVATHFYDRKLNSEQLERVEN